MIKKNKNIKSDIIPANPNEKISFAKKLRMYIWAKNNTFKFFRRTNKYWKYYTEFLEDLFNYGICGSLISLPFFYPSFITFGLAFGAGLFIYSKKIHALLIQLISQIRIVNIEGNKR